MRILSAKDQSGVIAINKIFSHGETEMVINRLLGLVFSETGIKLENFVVVSVSGNEMIFFDG